MNALKTSLLIALLSCLALGQSQYAGEEKREIKALSTEEIDAYLEGHGMGLARPAELNHYPGPRHVIELSEELKLSESQVAGARKIYDKMHEAAVVLGAQIVEREKKLDRLFAEGKISDAQMRSLVLTIALLQSRLRAVHLKAHLDLKKILSRPQIDKYDHLRGYLATGGKGPDHHH